MTLKPIRKLLLRELLLPMGLLVVVASALGWIGTGRLLDDQVQERARKDLSHLQEDIRQDLQDVERVGRTTARWWREGRLRSDDIPAADALVAPLLEEFPIVANLVFVSAEGLGISFLREAEGLASYHLDARREEARKRYLRRGGSPVAAPFWEPTPYRVRSRPWYAAVQQARDPHWVEAYRFVNLPTHGLSYVLPLRDAQGVFQGAVCADIYLNSLSRKAWMAQPTPGSQVLVSDSSGRALLLPRGAGAVPDPRQPAPFLNQLSPRFQPLFHHLLGRWAELGRTHEPIRLREGGQAYTCLVEALEGVHGMQWYLSLAVPDRDYVGEGQKVAILMLISGILVSVLATWRILRVAIRFSSPLEQLAEAARTLGEGTPTAPVPSGVAEIQTLGESLHWAGQALAREAEVQRQLQQRQRLETVGTLAGGIAHDVNNQLAAILGQLNLGKEHLPGDHPATRRMVRAEESVHRCAALVKSLLRFSRHATQDLQAVDLNDLVRRTLVLAERLLGFGIHVTLDLEEGLAPVQGDMAGLEQVVMNLALNARDAMPEGGKLTLSTRRQGEEALLAISDSGKGISEDVLPRIFDPFFTTKGVGKGSGLGLAMVFGIVQAHGGRIEVESPPGLGTTFRISLPLQPGGAAQPAAAGEGEEGSFAGRRILVVEDELPLRELLADGFTTRRAQVETGRDGSEGWMLWRGSRYDLVVSDQRMPSMTGLELLANIRATGSQVPVILISGFGLEGAEVELERDPRLRFLAKPFSFKQLFTLAGELLGGEPLA
jgi:signal transduction histidine kinase/CheY-like chemotaxis protein